MKQHLIKIDSAKCIGCGLCLRDCPENNITVTNKKARINSQLCIKCGHCVAVCPKAAVSMTGFCEPPEEIHKTVTLDPRQLREAVKTRRSIRQFKEQAVENRLIRQIIEAGRLTPTGGNAQNVSYIVLKNHISRYERIAVRFFRRLIPMVRMVNPLAKNITIDEHFFFKKAPAVILILSKDNVNGALAASNMELMAQACGLGVLYSGFFAIAVNHSLSLRRALGLKRGDKAVTALVLGYPAVKYYRTAQKDPAKVRWL